MSALKPSDVKFEEATFAPTARCRGILRRTTGEQDEIIVDTITECTAGYRPRVIGFGSGEPGGAKKWAKQHAQFNPGHEVVVERLVRAVYWTDAPEEPTDDQPK